MVKQTRCRESREDPALCEHGEPWYVSGGRRFCRVKKRERHVRWMRAHPNRVHRWDRENPEKMSLSSALWRKRNPEKRKESVDRYNRTQARRASSRRYADTHFQLRAGGMFLGTYPATSDQREQIRSFRKGQEQERMVNG